MLQVQSHPHHLVLLHRLSRYFGTSDGTSPTPSPQNPGKLQLTIRISPSQPAPPLSWYSK